jgi:hypothetical protein
MAQSNIKVSTLSVLTAHKRHTQGEYGSPLEATKSITHSMSARKQQDSPQPKSYSTASSPHSTPGAKFMTTDIKDLELPKHTHGTHGVNTHIPVSAIIPDDIMLQYTT